MTTQALLPESLGLNFLELIERLDNVGIYMTDLERRIIFWNEAAQKITGYEPAEVIGRTCHDNILCHTDRHGRRLCGAETCPLHHAIRTAKSSSTGTYVFAKHRNGKRVPMSVTVSPLRDAQGNVIGGIELFRDAAMEWEQLRLAQEIQRRFMPDPAELSRTLPLAFHWLPAEMVGGDVVQVRSISPEIVIGLFVDVSGHGVASALLTGFLWRSLEGLRGTEAQPAAILRELAKQYQALQMETHYFSALCFRYDLGCKRLVLSTAGHPQPILVDKTGKASYLSLTGDLIGLFDDPEFSEQTVDLCDSRLVVYSDGCVEAHDTAGNVFGGARFLEQVEQVAGLRGQDAARRLVDVVFDFTGAPDPEDDMTVLIIDSPG